MPVGPYNIAFSPPADFEDWTQYNFTEPSGREFVRVGYGSVPNSADTALDVMNQRSLELQSLKHYYPGAVTEPVRAVPIGKLEGAMVSYTAREQHYEFREWWAIALVTKAIFVQIVYYAPALDPASPGRLRRILASVGPPEETPPKRTSGGFIRRTAGRIALDVPERLAPPSVFSFDSSSGNVRLELSIFPHATAWTGPAGSITEREFESGAVDRMPATTQSFVLDTFGPAGHEHSRYMRGEIRYDDGVTVHIEGRAPADQPDTLNGPFRDLLRSIHRLE